MDGGEGGDNTSLPVGSGDDDGRTGMVTVSVSVLLSNWAVVLSWSTS